MAGYDDYQTEEEYIAASKRRWESEMDTKELVEPAVWVRDRTLNEMAKMHSGATRVYVANVAFDEFRVPLYTADAIGRLERERDELLNDIRIGCANIERAESEAATLRAHVAKMEEALRWELNILDVEVRPVVKPSKKEWIARRIERLRAALTEE